MTTEPPGAGRRGSDGRSDGRRDRRGMRILLLSHYYAPEYGAPQRRWSALVERFVAAGHQVTVAAPVPHYPDGRPTPAQRRTHRVGAVERGVHGETIVRTAYLPHQADIVSRTADHLVAAGDALRRLLARSSPWKWCSGPSVSGVRLSVRAGYRCSPRSRGWWW